MTFQRARTEEQREVRRRAILETASAMLDEMPVAEVTLNELSRRVGLAKTAVLRYFESREAVLLDLMDDRTATWLTALEQELAHAVDLDRKAVERAGQTADVLGRSLAAQTALCDLYGAQGGVLEHNVSVEVVRRHKHASLGNLAVMAGLVRRFLPEVGDQAEEFCLTVLLTAGALSAYTSPPPSLLAVYESEPALAVHRIDLRTALQRAIMTALVGMLPRS
ncbi:TetR/AcrR family transcriptional regulator [Lentzea flaviverrucosa]|uniref:Transcriptional regulator, TetR family n=1 Tax=Lentzea flaviverrucosa TaxID=200379 RepID=A0A1H9BY28_9PSEU|nr:TetR/AcrR family transcriptional regulator [Lentzea flaviverrucosa]RDI31634.1 TetR family transcriptional regulator [Lentzea flaviverrucosa]SEP93916.1 transcriptional regulator, TetR family [Lentzea flaviverrucosa]